MSINIIKDALEFFDNNNEKYENIKKKIKYIRIADPEQQKGIGGLNLIFYDKNKNKLFMSRVEVLGKYYNNIDVWVWGWSLPSLDKSLYTIIRKVFLYGTDITVFQNPESNKITGNIVLKNELITSRFRITDIIQLEIHCAIASYLSKKSFIFQWKDPNIMPSQYVDVKGEFSEEKSNVTYYFFIIDPPSV